ncbi:MAG: TonB-dependent receptor [Bacteroidetes bacterium]|nr:TonB-dependent receptor [Bacteroidota bacterium]
MKTTDSKNTISLIFKVLLVFLFLTCVNQVHGQKLYPRKLHGIIKDSLTSKPLAFATIQIVILKDSTFYMGTISDTLGYFNFSDIELYSFFLLFSYVGYEQKIVILDSTTKKNIDLGYVFLKQNTNELKEIKIVGNSHYIMNVDLSIYRPDSADLSNSVTSLDLFQRIPELKVDKISKSISIIGKPTMILINGNMQQGIDVNTINPQDIEKVEIINNPSSRYSSEYEGVINIIMKKELTSGFTALVNLDYQISKKNESLLMLQYATKKARFFGNYYFNHWSIPVSNSTDRIQYETNATTRYKSQYSLNNKKEFAHTGKFGVDYYPTDRTYINFMAQINSDKRNDLANFMSEQQTDNSDISLLNSEQIFKGNFLFQNYSLYFKKEINSLGKQLNSDINFYLMNSENNTDYSDTYFFPDTNILHRSQMDIGNKKSVNYHLDYFHPFSERSRFETGLQYYYQDFRNKIDQDGLTSAFKYTEHKSTYYIDYYTEIKKYNIRAGIRYEFSGRNVDDSIFNSSVLLPAFRLSRKLGNHIVSLNYNKRSYYPSVWQLSPEVTMIDSVNFSSGNPYLSAQLNNVYEINYRFRKGNNVISSTIYHILSKNVIRNVYSLDGGALVRKPYNASKRKVYGFKTTGSFQIGEDLELQPFFDLFIDEYSYQEDKSDLFTWEIEFSLDYYTPIGFYVGFEFGYTNEILQPQGYIKNVPQINTIYIQKTLFKGNGSVMLSYQNLFKNITTTYVSENLFDQESSLTISNSGFLVRFSYWFAKGKKIEDKRRPEYFEQDIK